LRKAQGYSCTATFGWTDGSNSAIVVDAVKVSAIAAHSADGRDTFLTVTAMKLIVRSEQATG
jgi:hypothetical protein